MIPDKSWPLVNGIPTLVVSCLNKDYDYTDYNNAVAIIGNGTYVDGWVNGYKLLTSGCAPDVPLTIAMGLTGAKRKTKNEYTYGIGALDLWRLFMECNNDIQCVLNKI
jgi:hypothetical protein